MPPRPLFATAARIVLLLAILLLLYVAYLTVRPVLVVIVLAAALASLVAPLFRFLVRHFHGRRRLASACAVALTFLCVLAPVGFLGTVAVQRLVAEGGELAHKLQASGPISVERLAARLPGALRGPVERALADVQPRLAAATPRIVSGLGGFISGVSRAALRIGIGLFLLAVALYYFFMDGTRWRERFVAMTPLPARDTRAFFDSFHRVSVAVVVGNLGTALTQALVATLGYFIFGAPVPLIWGAVTFFAALVPLVGPALVWLPVALIVGIGNGWWRGAGLVLYGVLDISTIDNVVRPLLTRRGLSLHPLLVFIAVFGGVVSFGAAGLFLGPLVIALVVTLVDVYERHRGATD
jgi:predicted PurR-regulated permease PerM